MNKRTDAIMSRRQALKAAAAAGAGLFTLPTARSLTAAQEPARLRARRQQPSRSLEPGAHPLGLGTGRDGVLIVPAGYDPARPAPLAVLLHGGRGSAERIIRTIGALDEFGIVALVPESRNGSWDIISGGSFGPDIAFIDRSLQHTFDHCNIDQSRVAVTGFSDGASYALMLGLANGDLFSHILSFSPGFFVGVQRVGKPDIFISHGTADNVLNIDRTSRRLVPLLRELGYPVKYTEFDGTHRVPPEIARDAFSGFAGRRGK